jgi:acetoin utilization protein AcuB
MDDTMAVARDTFQRTGFHHLLVVDEGKLVGVLSDRDLLGAVSPFVGKPSEMARDAATLNRRVHQVMTRRLRSVDPRADLSTIIHIFNNNQFSCIPVVDDSHRPVGVISWRDILRVIEPLLKALAIP